jgi:hypothetical protein
MCDSAKRASFLVTLALLPAPSARSQQLRSESVAGPGDIPSYEGDYLVSPVPLEARLYVADALGEAYLDNGLVRRSFRLAPNAATIGLDELHSGQALLRAVRPEAAITVNGERYPIGGLAGQPNHAFLRPEWLAQMRADPRAFRFVDFEVGEIGERLAWRPTRHHDPRATWPARGVHVALRFLPGAAEAEASGTSGAPACPQLEVRVHYELYDGLPVLSKWLEVVNHSEALVLLDGFSVELLAVVERESRVETREGVLYPTPQSLHIEPDYAFGGMTTQNSSRHAVHWRTDPEYASQVNPDVALDLPVRRAAGAHLW